jgi:hypothetical protein
MVADRMLVATDPHLTDKIFDNGPVGSSHYTWPREWLSWSEAFFYDLSIFRQREFRCKLHPLLSIVDTEVSDEEVAERFKYPDLCIRASSLSRYNALKSDGIIQDDQVIAAIPTDRNYLAGCYDTLKSNLELHGVELAPIDFNRRLWEQTLSDVMGVQFLGCLMSNWIFSCIMGSAALFGFLPVKTLYLSDDWVLPKSLARKFSVARFGALGEVFPLFNLSKFSASIDSFREFQRIRIPYTLHHNPACRTVMTAEEEKYFNVKNVTATL